MAVQRFIGWQALIAIAAVAAMSHAACAQTASARASRTAPVGALELLTPKNCTLALIDFQPQMAFGVRSHDRQMIVNNVVGLAKAAKVFKVPVLLSSVETSSFSGPTFPKLQEVLSDQKPIERSSMNAWEDENFRKAVNKTGRKKLLIAGLWTEVCVVLPTIEALRDGYEVYVVTDACGGTSKEAHDMAVLRVTQAGAVPVTWQQVMLEWQRDWSRKETYAAVTEIIQEHSGAYGMGVFYAKSMLGGQREWHDVKATEVKPDGGR